MVRLNQFLKRNNAEITAVMGMQYNTLAHMLLVVHDPTIPQLGPSHKQSRAVVDVGKSPLCKFSSLTHQLQRMVQEDVRTLCGVAQSNPRVFPCKFVACFAIALGEHPVFYIKSMICKYIVANFHSW